MLRSVLGAVPGKPRKEVDADREHWAQERAYWTERMRPWYREKYSLALDPIQKDVSPVPPADMVAAIQGEGKARPGWSATTIPPGGPLRLRRHGQHSGLLPAMPR